VLIRIGRYVSSVFPTLWKSPCACADFIFFMWCCVLLATCILFRDMDDLHPRRRLVLLQHQTVDEGGGRDLLGLNPPHEVTYRRWQMTYIYLYLRDSKEMLILRD
jgi:hypothetical protein